MIKAVIFDLDGTLLDTSEGIVQSVNYTLEQMGYSIDINTMSSLFVGPPIQESLMRYIHMDAAKAQEGANLFRSYYKEKALFMATPYPGVMELLGSLRKRGVAIAVATYKREDYALKLLEHFKISSYCTVIHGADNENRLTKADIVEKCCEKLSVAKEEMVLVGDTNHDAKGAFQAGIGFVGVGWGFGFKDISDISFPYLSFISKPSDLLMM